jgi:hypothetical protein
MTLTELLPSSIRRRFTFGQAAPIEPESTDTSLDVPVQTTAATPAPKVLDPAIAAHEAALTQGQALLGSGLLGHRRYI